MSIISGFLLWLEERQVGILSTIAIHLLIISLIMALKIRTNIEREYQILIDFSQISFIEEDETLEEQQQASAQEFVRNMQQQINDEVRNIPVNVADQRAAESIERMVREIMAEENISDPPPPPQDVPAAITSPEDINLYNTQFPVDASGERTVYTGQTTVSYELSGRRHTHMPSPVYRCRAGGTIVVNIVVNNNGYVVTAAIDRGRSNSEDPCLVDAAIQNAERSRFDRSTNAQQRGSITYVFQPQ